MHSIIMPLVEGLSLPLLLLVAAIAIAGLAQGAHLLVEEAVTLSIRLNVSKVLIGATVVSLGTTLPEVAVSVMAAVRGNPGLALGNAVGSIICDTGLILGLVAVIRPIPIDPGLANRQGYVQLGAGILMVAACVPYSNIGATFTTGGSLPQFVGILFLFLLVLYLWASVKWAGKSQASEVDEFKKDEGTLFVVLLKLVAGVILIILSSEVLIPTVETTALRLGVPDALIAATLVALGTSMPELATALGALRKGHSELAMGNAIGADVLNVLFVAGLSAAVTPGGLQASPEFFRLLFPVMLAMLLVFRVGLITGRDKLPRWNGGLLLILYGAYIFLSY